jgi:hypothetical protein
MSGNCIYCKGFYVRLGAHTACPPRALHERLAREKLRLKHELELAKIQAQSKPVQKRIIDTLKECKTQIDPRRNLGFIIHHLVFEAPTCNDTALAAAKIILDSDAAYKQFIFQIENIGRAYIRILPYASNNGTVVLIMNKVFPKV